MERKENHIITGGVAIITTVVQGRISPCHQCLAVTFVHASLSQTKKQRPHSKNTETTELKGLAQTNMVSGGAGTGNPEHWMASPLSSGQQQLQTCEATITDSTESVISICKSKIKAITHKLREAEILVYVAPPYVIYMCMYITKCS